MTDVIVARALHVLAVVIWIGGVSMATAVVLPPVRRGDLGADRLAAFQAIEHRFAWQARAAVVLAGLTGFCMVWRLDVWRRFRSLPLAAVRLRAVRRRAVHSAPPFPTLGDSAAGGRLRLAASGALAAAGAERGDDPARSRGEPGVVDRLRRGRSSGQTIREEAGAGAGREMKR